MERRFNPIAADYRPLDKISRCEDSYDHFMDSIIKLIDIEEEIFMNGQSFGRMHDFNLMYSSKGLRMKELRIFQEKGFKNKHSDFMISIFAIFFDTCKRWMQGKDWTFLAWKMLDRQDEAFSGRYQSIYLETLSNNDKDVYGNLLKFIRKPRSLSL